MGINADKINRRIERTIERAPHWQRRLVKLLSDPYQAKASSPVNGLTLPNGSRGAVTIEPYSSPIKRLQEDSRLALQEAQPDLSVLVVERAGRKESLKLLISRLQAPGNAAVRQEAAYELGRRGERRAWMALVQALREEGEEDSVREAAAYALGGIGDSRACKALTESLQSFSRKIRIAAATALGRIGGDRVFNILMEKIKSLDWAVRAAAVYGLGVLGDKRAFESILRMLREDDYWGVQEMAAKALARMNDGRAVKALAKTVSHRYPDVGRVAEDALGRLTDERGFDDLVKCLSSENVPGVIRAAASALRRMGGGRAFEVLFNCLISDSEDVRLAAAEALGGMGEAWLAPDLKERMKELKVKPEIQALVLKTVQINTDLPPQESRASEDVPPLFERELTVNEWRCLIWERKRVERVSDYKSSTFPASLINGDKEYLAVRFDDPRAGENVRELDQKKDVEIIMRLYPAWSLMMEQQVLEARMKSFNELKQRCLEQYPGIHQLNHSMPISREYNELEQAIERTAILIQRVKRGLWYYGY